MFFKVSKKIALVIFLIFVISAVNHLVGMGVNKLDINVESLEFERFIFVPGINTPKFYLTRWRQDLEANFPGKEIVFLDDYIYLYWQDDKTEAIVERGVELLNDGKLTIVISHSYGGVLAKTMIERSEGANIVKLITMASPHQMNSLGIDESKDFLGAPDEVDVPTYSFGGYIDPVVLFPFTSVNDTENLDDQNHQDLWSGHSGFLFSKDIRKQVLEYAFGTSTSEAN